MEELLFYKKGNVNVVLSHKSVANMCNSKGRLPDDHHIVTCLLEMRRRPGKIKEERVFRSFQEVTIVDFKDDL